MPEWLYEEGLGEARAALVADGVVVEALIDPDNARLRADSVVEGAFTRDANGRAIVSVDAYEALVARPAAHWTVGQRVRIQIVREALPERGKTKRAVGIATDAAPRPAPTLYERITATGHTVVARDAFAPSLLNDTDWGEVMAQATGAPATFDLGRLHVEPTRALTVIDVDGWGDPATLAVRAATVAAQAIRRLGIGGQIVIDFPSIDATARTVVTTAFDAALPKPFERSALGGFGLLQVVRPRVRPSLIELVRFDPAGFHARAALEQVRGAAPGARTLVVAPAIADWLDTRKDLIALLARELGGAVGLRTDATLPIWSSYAEPA